MNDRIPCTTIQTDVLVIGGGMAGWFAADKARAQGASVLLVDKGYVGKAGQSPLAGSMIVFNEEWGDDPDEQIEAAARAGEYLAERDWARLVLRNSYDRYLDLLSWGVRFETNEDGTPLRRRDPSGVEWISIGLEYPAIQDRAFRETAGYQARKHLEECGVTIMDRVMVAEYLQDDSGRVVGAVGLPMGKRELYVIRAGAVVSCAGASSYKPTGSGCLCSITGDNEAMAYRAGAELRGKEFVQPNFFDTRSPGKFGRRAVKPEQAELFGEQAFGSGVMDKRNWRNYDGTPFRIHEDKMTDYLFSYLELDLETHAGRGPVSVETPPIERQMSSGAALGMSLRHTSGLYPADMQCRSSLPGLYGAGDALSIMTNGTIYTLTGGCLAGAAVTGAIAGEYAAKEALERGCAPLSEAETQRVCDAVCAPLYCPGGYSPRWVSQVLSNTMTPYFVQSVKKGDRLEAALTMVEFMRDHLVPRLIAKDPHELRLAHETRNMVLVAEMTLRSALFRTESRGMHYREDYPMRDDENWLCWTKIARSGDRMELTKVPVPEQWRPDPALSYRERYPYRFPGETEEG